MTLMIKESLRLALMPSNNILIVSATLYLAKGIIHKVSKEKNMDNLTTLMYQYFSLLRT